MVSLVDGAFLTWQDNCRNHASTGYLCTFVPSLLLAYCLIQSVVHHLKGRKDPARRMMLIPLSCFMLGRARPLVGGQRCPATRV